MKAKTVTLVYFSPTGTTKKVLEGIAETIGAEQIKTIDLTRPDSVTRDIEEVSEGLAILGAPVYGGRIPVEAEERFTRVKGKNTPAVVVVVYGNREYDDALVEMREIALRQGFKPIAGGAFIGEHSYSSPESPLAAGRPDTQDIAIARDLGQKIAEKMEKTLKAEDIGELNVPGNLPLKERHVMKKIAPVTDKTLCVMCQTCLGVCPTGAITATNEIVTNDELCILCAACVKACPVEAKKITSPQVAKARAWLSETCRERKEPSVFID